MGRKAIVHILKQTHFFFRLIRLGVGVRENAYRSTGKILHLIALVLEAAVTFGKN
jgi:hypothetical protein